MVQLPSCAPLHLHNYPWEERGSPAAEQLATGKMDYINLLSPCLAHSVCIFKLSPPTRASPVPGIRGAPGSAPHQQFSLLGCTNILVRRMETDPLGQSPHCEGSWERGNEVGCYHLQVDLGTGVTLNTGVCKNAALHKLEKKNTF